MENAIAWIFIFPLFGAVACALLGMVNRKFCNSVAVLSMAGATWAGVETLLQAVASPQAQVSYILGGWTLDLFPRGVGIEFQSGSTRWFDRPGSVGRRFYCFDLCETASGT